MPMCDAYIPAGALDEDTERTLISRVTAVLVDHEIRRIVDLVDDAAETERIRKRASAIAWTFVHRTQTYVAGLPAEAPVYKFVCQIPEGQIDDQFAPAVNRDIMQAVADAEVGRWPHLERRIWVFVQEIPDGAWGAAGMPRHLPDIIDFVAPGMGAIAQRRWDDKRAAQARATVELAAAHTEISA
jgi:phenylpyruvate tautomerase PptA (4-oxalocrotonate tautomerase family)